MAHEMERADIRWFKNTDRAKIFKGNVLIPFRENIMVS